ncbi:SsgA family sporulation/cell division regulator [Streptomyces sp. PCS3-D2]|uniref:SsgA family sporulation/cell division regulator n=1 Tax=Streptomyces sp. PCS3-D2 TaxID=1460244 RepID=UPI0004511263|nr:SsgA family sporulation/cell division regulator [Streptomyces sp. PCS3-D2]WKV70413.1 SsgA family sporulation/cell division regulator [Streptomyces sp. PCS3-D2]
MDHRPRRPEQELTWTTGIHQVRNRLRFPLRATFHWSARAPLDVELTFHPVGADPVAWVIGRDLLARGLRTLAGTGEVRIRPTAGPDRGAHLLLRLGTAPPYALFVLNRAGLASWLERTWAAVPAGAEADRLDWEFFEGLLADR